MKKAYLRARRTDHLHESLLGHLQHHRLRVGLPSRTQEENPRESLFAGMQDLIHEGFVDSDDAREEIRDKRTSLADAGSCCIIRTMVFLLTRAIVEW
jgi:hypothetical protein